MKQDLLKKAYRRWFSRLNEPVPEEVWERIEDELDLDEVWKGIDANLPATRSLIPWKRVAAAAAVLLLLVAGSVAYRYIFRQHAPSGRAPLAEAPAGEMTRPGEAPAKGQVSKRGEVPAQEETSAEPGIPSQAEISAANDKNAGYSQKDPANPGPPGSLRPVLPLRPEERISRRTSPGTVPLDEIFAANIATLPAPRAISHGPAPSTEALPEIRLPEARRPAVRLTPDLLAGTQPGSGTETGDMETGGTEALALEKTPFVRVYQLGMASSYNNTWMLNHETFTGLRPSTLDATAATYGISTGINAAFLLNGRHRVGTELYFSSRSGQRYRQYIQARYLSRSIELDYFKLQLYYYLPVFSGKADVLAGGYVSYLKRGREEIGGEARAVGQFYKDGDYGLLTGLQFNLPVSPALELHPAIRINYGLPNIFKGDQLVPEDFLRTHNASLGLHLGISYKLPR